MPQLMDEPAAPAAPAKRPLWRRVLKWTLLSLLVVLVVVGAFVGFLHTGPGQRWVRHELEDTLNQRLHAKVALGELDFALGGDVHVGALTITPDADLADHADAPPAIELGGVDLALDWGSLLGDTIAIDELAVRHLHLRLTQRADGTTNLTGLSDKPLQLKGDKPLDLRSLVVEDVDVDLAGPDGTTHIRDLALHASAHVDPIAHTTVADLDQFSVGLDLQRPDGTHISVPALSLSAHVEAQGAPGQQTVQARLGGVETQARVERPGQATVDLPIRLSEVTLQADAAAVHAKLRDVQLAALTLASVSADLALGPDHMPAGSQRAEIQGLHIGADQVNAALGQSLLGTDVDVRFLVEGPLNRLAVDGQIDTAGGVMKLVGTADVSDPVTPRYDLTITASDVDTSKLVTQPGLPVRTSLKLQVKGAGLKPDAMNTDVHLDVGETHIGPHTIDGLVFQANAGEGAYHVRDLTLTVVGHKLTFEGDLNPAALTFRGRLTTAAQVTQLVEQVQQAGLLTVPLPEPLAGVGGDELSVDVTVAGKLRPDFLTVKPPDLPIQAASLTGFVRGKNLRGAGNTLGGLDLNLDLAVRDAKPSGTITLGLDDLTLAAKPGQPKQRLDKTTLVMEVAGDTYTLRLDTQSKRQAQRVHLVADARVDPNSHRVYATFRELDLAQGGLGTRLLAPVSLELPPGLEVANSNLVVPPVRLALAGGEVGLSAAVSLGARDPATAQPKLQSMDVDMSLRHIHLAQLPARVRRKLKGLRGTVDGTLGVTGTAQNPAVDFQLAANTNRARLNLEGGLHHRRLVLDATTRLPDGTHLADLSLEAPVRLGPAPGLAPGPLHLTVDARQLHLARLGDAVPPNLRDAVLTFVADIGGRTTAPDGRFKLSLAGVDLSQAMGPGTEQAALALSGRLQASAAHTALDVTTALTAAPGQAPVVTVPLSGTLDGSPVRGRAAAWDGALAVGPIDLAALNLPAPQGAAPAPKLTGSLTLRASASKARGRHAAPAGQLTVEGRGLGAAGVDVAPLDLTLGASADPEETGFTLALAGAGMELLKLTGGVPLGAKAAARLAKAKRLDKLPLSVRLELPRHTLAQLRALAPAIPDLPGAVGGALTIAGTAAAPTVDGALAYDGFQTLAGGPGRVALAATTTGQGDEAVIQAGLELGPPSASPQGQPVRVQVEVPRAQALAFAQRQGDDLGATVRVSSEHYPLLALVPAFAAKLQGVEVAGWLSSDLKATLAAHRGEDGVVTPDTPAFDGSVRVEQGRIALAALGRTFHDVGLELALTPDGVELRGLSVREDTPDRKDRALDVTGRLALGPGLKPSKATLKILTDKFLAVGEPDAPEAEIDADIRVNATLDRPVKDVDVEVAALNLYAPNRYLHDHWQRTVGMNDIVFVDGEHPVGVLPAIPKPFWVGLPARPPAGAKPGGVDLHVRIPHPTKVDFFPVNLAMQGDVQVQIREGAVWTHGSLQFPSGEAGLLGHTWKLYHGALTLDGPVSSLKVALDFQRLPTDPMRRDVSMGSTGGERGTFGLHVDLDHGLVLALGGTNGPYLGDGLAEANAGRARTYTVTGLPASSTLQFPHDDEAGLVLSYVSGNLPHLLFLDRSNAWADADDLEGGYGKIVHFRAQKLTSSRARRWRVVGRPHRAGRSTAELFHDWLFTRSHRSVAGFGLSAGTAASLGAELFWEWSSDQ